jgi:acylaminoacyl-peptidase
VLAAESKPSQPWALFAAHLPASEQAAPTAAAWGWSHLPLPDADLATYPAAVRESLPQLQATILQVTPTTPPNNVTCEAVVLHSKAAPGPRPTIITPHGGPHSVYTAQFFMPFAYLVSLGVGALLCYACHLWQF